MTVNVHKGPLTRVCLYSHCNTQWQWADAGYVAERVWDSARSIMAACRSWTSQELALTFRDFLQAFPGRVTDVEGQQAGQHDRQMVRTRIKQ